MVKLQILNDTTWLDVSESVTLQVAAIRQLEYQLRYPENVYRIITV